MWVHCGGVVRPAVHQIYVGTDSEKQPFFISVVLTDSNNQGAPQYKAILWKKTASAKLKTKKTNKET